MLPNLLGNTGHHRLVRARHGYVLYNANDTVVGRSIETYGEYYESEVEVFRQLCRPGDIVCDIGANIGVHTLALASIVGETGRVHAFEPHPTTFRLLTANVALNSLTWVDCAMAAVGAAADTVHAAAYDERIPDNFGGVTMSSDPKGPAVPLVRLDDAVDVPSLRFVKIDVEGMERDVIAGGRGTIARHRPILYVENDRLEQSRGLIADIENLDYALFWHFPPYFNADNFAGETTELFPRAIFEKDGRLNALGFGIMLLGVPREIEIASSSLSPVSDPAYHPLRMPP
jgi:FkbM family methyltransferase